MNKSAIRSGSACRSTVPAVLALLLGLSGFLQGGQPASWIPRGAGGGGGQHTPSFSPDSPPSELYIACDESELFHSTDLGQSWTVVDFRQIQSGGRGTRVQFSFGPGIRWAIDYTQGTNPVNQGRPAWSADGGATWHPLSASSWPPSRLAYFLASDPNDPTHLVASDLTTLYLSTNGGATFTAVYGVSAPATLFVGGAFFDSTTVWAGTSAGLLTGSTLGGPFALAPVSSLPSGEAMFSFTGARQGGAVRFLCASEDASQLRPDTTQIEHVALAYFKGVYVLNPGASSWSKQMTGIPAGDAPYLVGMAAGDIAHLWLAGANSWTGPQAYTSGDGGATCAPMINVYNNANVKTGWGGWQGDSGFGGQVIGLAVAPADYRYAVITNSNFGYITTNDGADWRQMYADISDQHPEGSPTPKGRTYHSDGDEPTVSNDLLVVDDSTLVATLADQKGFRSTDGGLSWALLDAPNTGTKDYEQVAKHPLTGALYAGTSTVTLYDMGHLSDAALDGGTGKLMVSTDAGAAWQVVTDFGHPVRSVALDPRNPDRVYVAVVNHGTVSNTVPGGIWLCPDITQCTIPSDWTKLPDPAAVEGHPYDVHVLRDGSVVATWTARIINNTNTYTHSSGVFITRDDGAHWSAAMDPAMGYFTRSLTVDPWDPSQSTWLVGVFGDPTSHGTGGLFVTTDRGATWSEFYSGVSVESAMPSPSNPDELWVATWGRGLLHADNRNAPTPVLVQDPAYPFLKPAHVLFNPWVPGEIWTTSIGNGLRVGTIVPDGTDSDGDGAPDTADCLPTDPATWAIPGEVANLMLRGGATTVLTWSAPVLAGSSLSRLRYDVLRSSDPADFSGAVCLASDLAASTASDAALPSSAYFYLVRAKNSCGGNLGDDFHGLPRTASTCP